MSTYIDPFLSNVMTQKTSDNGFSREKKTKSIMFNVQGKYVLLHDREYDKLRGIVARLNGLRLSKITIHLF